MDFVNIFETEVRVCKPYMNIPKTEICSIEDIRKNDAFTIFDADLILSKNDKIKTWGLYVCFDDGFSGKYTEESYIMSKYCRYIKCIDITDMSIREFDASGNCFKVCKLTDTQDQKILFKF